MDNQKFTLNPEISLLDNQSSFLKSPDKIGKIFSKQNSMCLHQSTDQLNLQSERFQKHSVRKAESENQSRLIFNTSLYFTPLNKVETGQNFSDQIEMSPVKNKLFRINKIYSSEATKFINRKKTPQLIGKLSVSKLNFEIFDQQNKPIKKKLNRNRSPGHFTTKIDMSLNQKRQFQALNNQAERFTQRKLTRSHQKSQLTHLNQKLKKYDKPKQRYLQNLIGKHCQQVRKVSFQLPVPQKNIRQLKYNYPVQTRRSIKKINPYLQRISKNSNLLQGLEVSPKFTPKQKQKTNMLNLRDQTTRNRLEGEEQIFSKSRSIQMKITPEFNVSFTLKTPRKVADFDQKIKLDVKKENEDFYSWKQNLSRVSLYSPQLNSNYNNRTLKHVPMLIDPFPQEQQDKNLLKKSRFIDLSKFSQYFSRKKQQLSISSYRQQQPHTLTLNTKVSQIKELLIQSMQTINIRFFLPAVLCQNKQITTKVQIKDLHLFMEKVYNEMNVRPQIVTVRRYDNAIFTGVFSSSAKDSNVFQSIIYHFNHGIYVGGWKQNRNIFENNQTKVDGCKEGKGVQILYEQLEEKEDKLKNPQNPQNPSNRVKVQVYNGQFINNQKEGYGINLRVVFNNDKIQEQIVQIGCWSKDLKHGWVKTYKNDKIQQNAQYEDNLLIWKRSLRGEIGTVFSNVGEIQ